MTMTRFQFLASALGLAAAPALAKAESAAPEESYDAMVERIRQQARKEAQKEALAADHDWDDVTLSDEDVVPYGIDYWIAPGNTADHIAEQRAKAAADHERQMDRTFWGG